MQTNNVRHTTPIREGPTPIILPQFLSGQVRSLITSAPGAAPLTLGMVLSKKNEAGPFSWFLYFSFAIIGRKISSLLALPPLVAPDGDADPYSLHPFFVPATSFILSPLSQFSSPGDRTSRATASQPLCHNEFNDFIAKTLNQLARGRLFLPHRFGA